MNEQRGAIAIFVKTPGLSNVKTRLAQDLGTAAATEFHIKSARATESVVKDLCTRNTNLTPFWAVAEPEGQCNELWKSFASCGQGEGSLGERLCHVYTEFILRYDFVVFLGADSPQMSSDLISDGIAKLSSKSPTVPFVIGPAEDGGFYLFAGSKPIPREIWLETPYSVSSTASVLKSKLQSLGSVHVLPSLFDVDTLEDLKRLQKTFSNQARLTPEQARLSEWLATLALRSPRPRL